MAKTAIETKNKQTAEEVNEVFDALTGESYFGTNMRMVMYNLCDADMAVLRGFAEICRMKRGG
jgi:hypothetical protein